MHCLNMDKDIKLKIKKDVEVFMRKYPQSKHIDLWKFLQSGETLHINFTKAVYLFVLKQYKKYKKLGYCVQRKVGSGRKPGKVKGNKSVESRISRAFLGRDTPGTRNVAKKLGISQSSVVTVLKRKKIRPFKKYREQALTDDHKKARKKLGKWYLSTFGRDGKKGRWLKYANTDFSATIRTHQRHNTKNNVVYGQNREDIRDKLTTQEKKFSPGVMLWGGISARGLIPPTCPLFVNEVLADYNKRTGEKSKNINNQCYADMSERLVKPAIDELYLSSW